MRNLLERLDDCDAIGVELDFAEGHIIETILGTRTSQMLGLDVREASSDPSDSFSRLPYVLQATSNVDCRREEQSSPMRGKPESSVTTRLLFCR